MPATETAAPTCRVLRAGDPSTGKQGLDYAVGVSAESCAARGLHMQLVRIPPGARARAHKHATHESAVYVLQGEAGMYFGPRLEHHVTTRAGDFLYIPADMPHLPYNAHPTEECIGVITRTDPNEQESVVVLPELECLVPGLTPADPLGPAVTSASTTNSDSSTTSDSSATSAATAAASSHAFKL